MTQQEIIKNNKLIANFLNLDSRLGISGKKEYKFRVKIDNWHNEDRLRFNEDWNWLMYVIDHIEHLDTYTYSVSIWRNNITIVETIDGYNTDIIEVEEYNTKLESCYNAIIQFIKWYNEKKINISSS